MPGKPDADGDGPSHGAVVEVGRVVVPGLRRMEPPGER
jgi:hypothetical protein